MKLKKHLRIKVITLEPVSSVNVIRCPDDTYSSEFEVQAFLYSALKALGVDVRGEVKWVEAAGGPSKRKTTCRFDLVIFEDKKAKEIIEMKNSVVTHRVGLEDTRQGRRYRLFGVPVTFVYGMRSAEEYLKRFAA